MESDFLIIGSGIAGLSFALRVAESKSVVIITKKEEADSATNLAQGGIAAVLSEDDSLDLHIEDTLASGDGLCAKDVVEMVVTNGPKRVHDLMEMGVTFAKDEAGTKLSLGREGGHSKRRIAHSYDLTGRAIEKALIEKARENTNITILEGHTAIDLALTANGKRCLGAYVLLPDGTVDTFSAKVTILSTGGCGKVYLYTSNPDISTGDGIAMAFRAGADIANMEFVQFHPTCLYHPLAKNFLISEAVRGEGGVLVDGDGMPFMKKYEKAADLATRDKVARAIDKEMKEKGTDCVYLDITHKTEEYLKNRFPTIYGKCLEFGINISKEPIPVVPAAHYMCGGVVVNTWGQSSLDGLFALGECSNTGLHGGNRLASNSLLEAVVYAERSSQFCLKNWHEIETFGQIEPWKIKRKKKIGEEILINHNWDSLRRIMWNYVGIVRNAKRLQLAKERISTILREIDQHIEEYELSRTLIELRNLSQVAMLIVEAALKRKRSRGLHFIIDEDKNVQDEYFWNVFGKIENQQVWNVGFRRTIDIN